MQSYNQKMRNISETKLVPTILQSFSFTLSTRDTFASPNGVYLRELTVGLCTITLDLFMFLLYYELFYFLMCVLVIFSGRALTIVHQKNRNNQGRSWVFSNGAGRVGGRGSGSGRGIIAIRLPKGRAF